MHLLQSVCTGIQQGLGLGLKPQMLTFGNMGLRAIVIYVAALLMVRLVGDKRLSGKYAAFDVILSITFGSLLSRAINGSAPFLITLGTAVVLVSIHWLFAVIECRSRWFSKLISGQPLTLIQQGEIQTQNLLKCNISQRELMASLRHQAQLSDAREVEIARLESGGNISIIPASPEPKILEISVEKGVQTIRLRLE